MVHGDARAFGSALILAWGSIESLETSGFDAVPVRSFEADEASCLGRSQRTRIGISERVRGAGEWHQGVVAVEAA